MKLNLFRLAKQSLIHFWRSNLSIALGVAAATAVLTGALIVGDSMRGSLQQLTLDRLAGVDEVLRGQSFFRRELAYELSKTRSFQEHYQQAIPAIYLPQSTAQFGEGDARVQIVGVSLFGSDESLWSLDEQQNRPTKSPADDEIIINRTLADSLGIQSVDPGNPPIMSIRLPIQGRVAGDNPLGDKEAQVEFVGDLKVIEIIEDSGLGRFSMYPTQLPPRNAFVSLNRLQDVLGPKEFKNKTDSDQVNVVFLQGNQNRPPTESQTESLQASIRPSLADLDLRVKRVRKEYDSDGDPLVVFDYFSFSSDQMILSEKLESVVQTAFEDAKPVFTYLANRIQIDRPDHPNRPIPFSMVSAIDFDADFAPISAVTGKVIGKIPADGIVLNSWTAEKLDAKLGDPIELFYFEPETTEGEEVETSIKLKVFDIAKLTTPKGKYRNFPNGRVIEPRFETQPQIVNDPDLTPEVPGLTDAESVDNWDLPFETPGIEGDDDDYWQVFRTTPKAFVALETGRKHWSSRFGQTTSYRIKIRGRDEQQIRETILHQLASENETLGLELIPVKRQGLAASSGSTPFDALFLSLSMFVIAAALMLVSILFRLSFQTRANQIGILAAVGLRHRIITRVWLIEMFCVSGFGALLGLGLGLGYAALMLLGLRTWWVGAISTPFIELHIGWISLVVGVVSGAIICWLTIWFSIWRSRKQSVRGMLSGRIESMSSRQKQTGRWGLAISLIFAILGIASTGLATTLGGESQAGAFLGGGFCFLAAMLVFVWIRLRTPRQSAKVSKMNLGWLAILNAYRSPLRSTLTIGLVASASFLIVAISSFQLSPTEEGTAGFKYLAQTELPIFEDLNDAEVQKRILGRSLDTESLVLPMRLKAGEDASCNNPYQSTQPRVIGISERMVRHFDSNDDQKATFAFAGSSAKTESEKTNPWRLLESEAENGAIPVIIDKNTAWYSLKVYMIGNEFEVEFDSGEKATFQVVGFLSNSILQGSLLIGEQQFVRLFPQASGYRMFLMNLDDLPKEKDQPSETSLLKNQLSDYGLDLQDSDKLLSGYLAVQNTYLSTFQALGALGLLLGTFGLAAVQMRSVLERKQELALMRAIGFAEPRLGKYVLFETVFLLLAGLSIGTIAAAFVTLPHSLLTQLSVPWLELAAMFGAILIVGLLTAWIASRWISRLPILSALRN